MNIKIQKKFALALLDFHGGQSSGLYAVGSCMLSDSDKGLVYAPANHRGHDGAIVRAVAELRGLKKDANHPEAVRAKDERDANRLADRLDVIRLGKIPRDERVNGVRVRCFAQDAGQDRWTVVYVDQREASPGSFAAVGACGHTSAMLGKHLGRRVRFADLPDSLRAVVQRDCEAS